MLKVFLSMAPNGTFLLYVANSSNKRHPFIAVMLGPCSGFKREKERARLERPAAANKQTAPGPGLRASKI